MTTEFKMVKVSDQGVQFGNAWYSHERITGYSADQLSQGNCCVTGGAYMKWLAAAPASPQASLSTKEIEDLSVLREMKADADSLGECLDEESLSELKALEARHLHGESPQTEQPEADHG